MCGSEEEHRLSPHRLPAHGAGTCVHEAAGPAAAGSVCVSLGQLWGPLMSLPHLRCQPLGASALAAEAAAEAAD